jgi:hypothetical protein
MRILRLVPYGVDPENAKLEQKHNEEAYKIKKREPRLNTRYSHEDSPTRSEVGRGAGISIAELQRRRDRDYTLNDSVTFCM